MPHTLQTAFCTIVTQSHLDYALALYLSYRQFSPEVPFYILVSDIKEEQKIEWDKFPDINVLGLEALNDIENAKLVKDKYQSEPDLIRWSLKPALMLHLLQDRGIKEVLFLDCDLCFFQDFTFIREQLSQSATLLSPHWRSDDPFSFPNNFRLNFTDGMYNGGFVGATQEGIFALDWWLSACLYRCERTREEGYYDDQKYLDLLPAQFPGTQILHHRGCNVANWNLNQNIRTQNGKGEVLILDKWPIIFIHFSGSTVKGILKDKDPLLSPYLDRWKILLDEAADFLEKARRKFELPNPGATPLPKRILNKLGLKAKK
ncbi:MAG: hypothetical protein AB8H47_26575 [Bacteroidia bacterium]